jgi:hypothetical protein
MSWSLAVNIRTCHINYLTAPLPLIARPCFSTFDLSIHQGDTTFHESLSNSIHCEQPNENMNSKIREALLLIVSIIDVINMSMQVYKQGSFTVPVYQHTINCIILTIQYKTCSNVRDICLLLRYCAVDFCCFQFRWWKTWLMIWGLWWCVYLETHYQLLIFRAMLLPLHLLVCFESFTPPATRIENLIKRDNAGDIPTSRRFFTKPLEDSLQMDSLQMLWNIMMDIERDMDSLWGVIRGAL